MPAIVHTNSALLSGMAVTSESLSEEASGLVRVRMDYVHRSSKAAQLNKLFYSDAPPPIFPSMISPSDLLERRLYMVQRAVSQENGLTYVQADYAGAFANKRRNHLRYVSREGERRVAWIYPIFQSFQVFNPAPEPGFFNDLLPVTFKFQNSYSYTWVPFVITYEYAQINGISAYTPVAPDVTELYTLIKWDSNFTVRDPERGWLATKIKKQDKAWFSQFFRADERVLTDNEVAEELPTTVKRALDFEHSRGPIKQDLKASYVTPTVKTIQHRFYL
jgi:hypothetical protein